jgi:arginyl-tRNA--protein-N-Asp/Glu arginylyltransferase
MPLYWPRPEGVAATVTDQSFKFPRFFVTAPSPCPYVPGRFERKVFTELKRNDALEMNEALARIGFRRSQNIVYRPSCDDCSACVSVRVAAREFKASDSQKRLLKRHADLEVSACEPWSTEEQFELLQRYVGSRHPSGGMAMMDAYDFADMIEQTPVDTVVVEYREPATDDRPGRLVGACLTDKQSDGLSMVYSFYDPALTTRPGLGTFIILDHIVRAARAELPFVYLGYWIEGVDRMTYKTRFKPVEKLTARGWVRAA